MSHSYLVTVFSTSSVIFFRESELNALAVANDTEGQERALRVVNAAMTRHMNFLGKFPMHFI